MTGDPLGSAPPNETGPAGSGPAGSGPAGSGPAGPAPSATALTADVDTARPSTSHICWSYEDPAVFAARARDFLQAGLAAGARVWFVTPGDVPPDADPLSGLDGAADALRQKAAEAIPLAAAYTEDEVVDPPALVHRYAAATERALADGYTGLRVVADATSLVRTPAQLDAFARYEHLIDRYMVTHPLSGMCGYDRRVLGDRAIAELACMHPEANTDEALFRLSACHPANGAASLAGELDPSNHDLFRTALERADPSPVDGQLVVHASRLRFIDHRSLLALREHAQRRGATAVLLTNLSVAGRLVELLDLPEVRVEAAA